MCDGQYDFLDKTDAKLEFCEVHYSKKAARCVDTHFSVSDEETANSNQGIDQGGILCRSKNQPFLCIDATQLCNDRSHIILGHHSMKKEMECFHNNELININHDSEDEATNFENLAKICSTLTICRYDEFRCTKNGKSRCLPMKDYLCNGIEDCDGSELDSNSTNSDNSGLSPRFLDDIGSKFSNFWDKVSNIKDDKGLLNSYDFGDFEGFRDENKTLCDAVKKKSCKCEGIMEGKYVFGVWEIVYVSIIFFFGPKRNKIVSHLPSPRQPRQMPQIHPHHDRQIRLLRLPLRRMQNRLRTNLQRLHRHQ